MIKKFKKSILLTVFASLSLSLCGCEQIGKELSNIPDMLQGKTEIATNNALNGDVVKQYRTAIENGNIEWIKEIVANNPDLDVNYVDDGTAIYCACWDSTSTNKSDLIKLLISLGADPNVGNQLAVTTYAGAFDLTCSLLSYENIDFNYSTEFGETYLSLALQGDKGGLSKNGYYQVRALIEAGMRPYPELFLDNLKEGERGTHFLNVVSSPIATKYLIQLLLEDGQKSGLKKAVEYAFLGEIGKCAEALANASSNEYNDHEKDILTKYAAYFGTPEQYENITKFTGIKIEKDFMRHLVESGNLDMIKYLSEKLEIDYSDKEETDGVLDSLDWAIAWGYADICKYLLSCNYYIGKYEVVGYIGMDRAIGSENIDIVKMMYQYIKTKYGFNEFDLGRAYGQYTPSNIESAEKIAGFFFNEGYDFSCVELGGNKDFSEYLYKKGRPLTPTDLTNAITSKDSDYVWLVLTQGADIGQKAYKNFNGFPWNISYAPDRIITDITYEKSERQEYPVDYNMFIAYFDENYDYKHSGSPLLVHAIIYSDSEIVKTIIDNGYDINREDHLVYVTEGSAQTLRVLLDAGVDTSLDYRTEKDKEFVSIAEFYERNGRSDLAQIVKEYDNR